MEKSKELNKKPGKKVKCACSGCGREFMESKGVLGEDNKLYCTKEHAEIAKIIEEAK